MDINFFLSTVGVVPSTSTKPAVTLFILSLFVTFSSLVEPFWLSGFIPITVFGLIVLVDIAVSIEEGSIDFIQPAMPIIKAVLTMLIVFSMFSPELSTIVEVVNGEPTPWWVLALRWVWTGIIGILTWYSSVYRNVFQLFLFDTDDGNDIGLLSFHSWIETLFAGVNTIFFLFVPVLSIILFVVAIICLWGVKAYFESQEEKKRVICHACGVSHYGSALVCPSCGSKHKTPLHVGLLGQTSTTYAKDRETHRWNLIAVKRCPQCATKLDGRNVDQTCKVCNEVVLGNPEALKEYIHHYESNLLPTLLVCTAVGLIPFAGVVAGVIYYRLTLISPLRRYVPKAHGCFARWGLRLFNIILISFQPIPVLGALIMPVMCYTNYQIYRSLLVRSQFKP